MSSANTALKGSLALASTVVLVSTANAQAISTGSVANYWNYHIDPSSLGNSLDVSAGTEQVYFLEPNGAYGGSGISQSQTGDGTTLDVINNDTGYNLTTQSGTNAVVTTANSGTVGTAFASAGSSETLTFTNPGTLPVLVDLQSSLGVIGYIFPNGYGYASEFVKAGVNASDPDGLSTATPSATLTGSTGMPYDFTLTGGYVYGVYTYYPSSSDLLNWSFLVDAGDPVNVTFYVASSDFAEATPAPSPACTMAFGLAGLGLLARRRRRRELICK